MTTAPTPDPELRLPARDPALELARLIAIIFAGLCFAIMRELCKNPLLITQAGHDWRSIDRVINLFIRLIGCLAASKLPRDRPAQNPATTTTQATTPAATPIAMSAHSTPTPPSHVHFVTIS